jgi:chemotaxis protein MotA
MSYLPLGFTIALLALAGSVVYLGQPIMAYYDFVGVIMVIGGTIAATIMVVPWEMKKEVKWAFSKAFRRSGFPLKTVVNHCLASMKTKSVPSEVQGRLYGELLSEGYELIHLGIESDKVQQILEARLDARLKRLRRVSMAIKGIAKYPPAFGLMGTVFGLIKVMQGISKGMSATDGALEMGLALACTMYGLLAANFLIAPFGEILSHSLQAEEYAGEIAISAVVLSMNEDSGIVSSEFLQSFLPSDDRSQLDSDNDFERAA